MKQVIQAILQDCRRYADPFGDGVQLSALSYLFVLLRPAVTTLALYRLSHYLHSRGYRRLAGITYRFNLTLTGADINPISCIGPGCLIVHTVGTVFHGTLGSGVSIYAHVVIEPSRPTSLLDECPIIGDAVSLGSNSTVHGAVRVADRVTITPFSLIDSSIEESDSVISYIPGKTRLIVVRGK